MGPSVSTLGTSESFENWGTVLENVAIFCSTALIHSLSPDIHQ